MLDRIKKTENRRLINNFTNYGIFQVFNYIVPLITIPYIVRVIGSEKFGNISLALAVIYYFRIITEYGFSITGVQLIAQSGDNRQNKSEIYSTILYIQTFFMIIGFLILLAMTHYIPTLRYEARIYIFTYGIVPANVLMTLWYFIGSERVSYINLINFVGRLIYIIGIFIFIQKADDYYLIPVINSLAYLFSGLVSIFLIIKKFKLHIKMPCLVNIKKYIVDGWPLFISNFGINLYRNTNIIILGFIADKEIVGLYSAGEKIIKAVQSVFAPITQTLFPFISRVSIEDPSKSIRLITKILKYMAILSGTITLFIIIFADQITRITLGSQFLIAKSVIQIGALVILFGVLNYIIGIIFMTNFGLKKEFSKSVIITGIANIIICYILTFRFGIIGTSVSFAGAEFILLLSILLYLIKYKSHNYFSNNFDTNYSRK